MLFFFGSVGAQAPSYSEERSDQYVREVYVPTSPKVQKGVYSPSPGSCLASVQYWIPEFPTGVGVPNNVMPNTQVPSVGVAILTTESYPGKNTGHVGQVVGVSVTTVRFRECNKVSGQCGYREIQSDSSIIRGYWTP